MKDYFLSQVEYIEYLGSDWHNRWLWEGCNHIGDCLLQKMDFLITTDLKKTSDKRLGSIQHSAAVHKL